MKRKYTKEILPCPFCGAKDPKLIITNYSDTEKFYHIECNCGAMMTKDGMLFDNQNECIRAWNSRKKLFG